MLSAPEPTLSFHFNPPRENIWAALPWNDITLLPALLPTDTNHPLLPLLWLYNLNLKTYVVTGHLMKGLTLTTGLQLCGVQKLLNTKRVRFPIGNSQPQRCSISQSSNRVFVSRVFGFIRTDISVLLLPLPSFCSSLWI